MLTADYVFIAALVFVAACSIHFAPRIRPDRVAMQWGFDGKPTWHAPKWLALSWPVLLMLLVRLIIWAGMTYTPSLVHGPEIGIVLSVDHHRGDACVRADASCEGGLKHDPEKWIPVFGKDHASPIAAIYRCLATVVSIPSYVTLRHPAAMPGLSGATTMKTGLIIAALAALYLAVPASPAFAQFPTGLKDPPMCKVDRCLRNCVRNRIQRNCHQWCRRCT